MKVMVKKEDAAYLYQILESYEGLTNYSTLDGKKEDGVREILLHLPNDSKKEVIALLDRLKKEIWLQVTE